MSLSNIYF